MHSLLEKLHSDLSVACTECTHSVWGQFWVIQAHGLQYVIYVEASLKGKSHKSPDISTAVTVWHHATSVSGGGLQCVCSPMHTWLNMQNCCCRKNIPPYHIKHWAWGRKVCGGVGGIPFKVKPYQITAEHAYHTCHMSTYVLYVYRYWQETRHGNTCTHKCLRRFPNLCVKPRNDPHTGQDFGHTEMGSGMWNDTSSSNTAYLWYQQGVLHKQRMRNMANATAHTSTVIQSHCVVSYTNV